MQQRSGLRWTREWGVETEIWGRQEGHIAMVASIGWPPLGRKALAGVRSALFFAHERPLCFHLLVDEKGEADVRRALATLESWLKSRGRFKFYRGEALDSAWRQIMAAVPQDCLDYSARYGSAGWLRLFAHEIILDPEVELVAWIDAGDYVFLEDPAHLLRYGEDFEGDEALGAPGLPNSWAVLPLQLMDLPRLRRLFWSQLVVAKVQEGYASLGPRLCELGEGRVVHALRNSEDTRRLWHQLPGTWAYEPWAMWLPGHGIAGIWRHSASLRPLLAESAAAPSPDADGALWLEAAFPGLVDFTTVRVHCPGFLEVIATHASGVQRADPDVQARFLFFWWFL